MDCSVSFYVLMFGRLLHLFLKSDSEIVPLTVSVPLKDYEIPGNIRMSKKLAM